MMWRRIFVTRTTPVVHSTDPRNAGTATEDQEQREKTNPMNEYGGPEQLLTIPLDRTSCRDLHLKGGARISHHPYRDDDPFHFAPSPSNPTGMVLACQPFELSSPMIMIGFASWTVVNGQRRVLEPEKPERDLAANVCIEGVGSKAASFIGSALPDHRMFHAEKLGDGNGKPPKLRCDFFRDRPRPR